MTIETLNGTQLKEIAHRNESAIETAIKLNERQRLRHNSDITRMKTELVRAGKRIQENEFMQFWKDLQSAGVGSIVYGRKGKADRFMWHYNLKSVAKAMNSGSDEQVESIAQPKAVKASEPVKRGRGRPKGSKNKPKEFKRGRSRPKKLLAAPGDFGVIPAKLVSVPIRKNFVVSFGVPKDVTKSELNALSKAVRKAI